MPAILATCLVGCALTRSDGKFEYRPELVQLEALSGSLAGTSVRSVVVTDMRKDIFTRKTLDDQRILVNKRNNHGAKMEGVFAVDHPLSEYVAQAFDAALSQAHVSKSLTSPLELQVRLDILDDPVIERGFFKTKWGLALVANITLFNRQTGKEVWHQPYIGRAELRQLGLLPAIDDYTSSLPVTLNDLAAQCLSTPAFQIALRSAR